MVVEVDQPGIGPVRLLGHPVKMSGTPADPTRPAPELGEHTEQVLREAGMAEDEIAGLMGSGAVAGPSATAEQQPFLSKG
jgi:formyl-CoA transferase